ncbi:MAG TPA: SDR family oxidoreductase [Steroidobacteraceae bacterium]|nr:SDR family oxidoreductase [Steroidobacteraceae bacterium]
MSTNVDQPSETPVWNPSESQGTAGVRQRLANRRILVVGAGTQPSDEPDPPLGNGQAIAILCAREGAMIACADRNEDAARITQTKIQTVGGKAIVLIGDVSDAKVCDELVANAEKQMGGLDGVVLNVGIGLGRGLEGTDAALWDQTFAVNLRSHFLIARAAVPRMSLGSALVFISSTASLRPGTGIPAYDASKAGIAGLCRHVANEGARRGVRANVVRPRLIETPLGRNASKRRASRARTPIPLGRQGTAWEVAYATAFLLSAEASYITGQSLIVDGGLSTLR